MSFSRLVSSLLVAVVALGASPARAATAQAPPAPPERPISLPDAAGPVEQRAKPVTAANPVPRRLSSTAPVFPAEARASGSNALVTVRMTVDESGSVAEARQVGLALNVSGQQLRDLVGGASVPNVEEGRMLWEAFTRAAVDAARSWQFEAPVDGPVAFNVRFQFDPRAETRAMMPGPGVERDDEVARARATLRDAQESAARSGSPSSPSSTPQPGRASAPPPGPAPVRVGGNIQPPVQIKRVNPVYPPGAREQTVQGVIILEATIGVDGRVVAVQILRSIPLLDQAALDAVRQWEYSPTLLNGVPVPVIMTVTVQFTLGS